MFSALGSVSSTVFSPHWLSTHSVAGSVALSPTAERLLLSSQAATNKNPHAHSVRLMVLRSGVLMPSPPDLPTHWRVCAQSQRPSNDSHMASQTPLTSLVTPRLERHFFTPPIRLRPIRQMS